MDDKLKAALEFIRGMCIEYFDWREGCVNCPLHFRGGFTECCFIESHSPSLWQIDELEDFQERMKEQEEME